MKKKLESDAVLIKNPDMDAVYVEVPFDIKSRFWMITTSGTRNF